MISDFHKASDFTRSLFKINDPKILEIKKYGEDNNIPITPKIYLEAVRRKIELMHIELMHNKQKSKVA